MVAKLFYFIVTVTWLYYLLKGVRGVWMITVGIYGLGLVAHLISGSLEWQAGTLSGIGLLLLLLPVTRRYFMASNA